MVLALDVPTSRKHRSYVFKVTIIMTLSSKEILDHDGFFKEGRIVMAEA